jgi:Kef-type K+ transport system membrane component KefB
VSTSSTFLIVLACILIAAKIAGFISQKLGIPAVLGQLAIGIIVGPSILGWLHPEPLINSLASLGVILLMFIAGLETDMVQMRRVGVAASVSACLGVVLPFVAGSVLTYISGYSLPTSLFVGTLLTATSVSISAQTLKELGKLRTKEGTTILGAAVIDDVLGLIVLSLILAFTLGQNPLWSILKMVLYFPIAYLLGHYGFPLLSRWLPRLLALEVRIGFVLALVLLYSWSAQELGSVAAITGAYTAGILVNRTEMREWVHDGLSKIGYAFFIPIFFVYVGIEANFHGVSFLSPLFLLSFTGIALITKVIGCGGGAFLCRFRPIEALTVGVGMISRGEVALITATIGLQAGLINNSLFSVVVLITLITTLVTPVLLKLIYVARARTEVKPVAVTEPLLEMIEEGMEDLLFQEEANVHRSA